MPKASDLTLNSEFETTGKWWTPDNPERTVAGTLKYSPTSIALQLIGSLAEQDLAELGVVRDDFERFPLIHGQTDLGTVSLVGAYCTSTNHNLSEVTESCYGGQFIIVGAHADDELIPISSLSFESDVLDEFFGRPRFDTSERKEGGKVAEVQIKYPFPSPATWTVEDHGFSLVLEESARQKFSKNSIAILARKVITIKSQEAMPALWFLERMWRACELLSLLSDESVAPTRVQLSGENAKGPILLLWQSSSQVTVNPESGSLVFYFAHFGDSFSDILGRWFAASSTLRDGMILFNDGRDRHGQIEGRFLTLTQAVEAVSRAGCDDLYMPAEEYEEVKRALINAIPEAVATDHRASLKSRITFGNEVSLRKRLGLLLEHLGTEATTCVCTSRSNFIDAVVKTRNHLTHHSDEHRDQRLKGTDLHWACEKLTMMLRFLLLRYLGIAPERSAERFKQHPRLMQYMHLWRGQGEGITNGKKSVEE